MTVTKMGLERFSSVFVGTFVHAPSLETFEILENRVLAVDAKGTIQMFEEADSKSIEKACQTVNVKKEDVVKLGSQFMCPGFVDIHAHAPQFTNCGTGLDIPLLQWLEKYTFPLESQFKDNSFAESMYNLSVGRHLQNGTTTISYFGTIHLDACKVLVDVVRKLGQRAFVGKVNMDQNSPGYYIEDTDDSIQKTEEFVKYVLSLKDDTVTPVITPRFVPTCTSKLLLAMGEMAEKYDLPIQSHVSENLKEIEWVKELHPECASYTDVYKVNKLLTKRTIHGHGVHLTEEEIQSFIAAGASIAHCANSNFSLNSGIMPARRYLKQGLKFGLATDVSGGYSPSMLDAIRTTMTASKAKYFANAEETPLNFKECFYLATMGGANCLGIADRVGSFAVGKQLDALVVDPLSSGTPLDITARDTIDDIVSKFVYMGDARNIASVFVDGRKVSQ
eukprot:GCRY01001319.1.p1 GENE.GCRY01001319.1~~GCRY01001319.1.p1  ORF type:complete len:448 (-),score=114.31 GCRY01001319.1:30-1373(-)